MTVLPVLLLCFVGVSYAGYLQTSGKYFTHNGQRVFLSGCNTAWVHFAHDFGNHQYQNSRGRYLELMDKVRNAGGNSMRTWVHIEGQTSPNFDNTGHVVGLDSAGSFLSEFKQYLDDARDRGILVFPTLWNGALKQSPGPLSGLITVDSKLQSYLDHALIPWVQAVKNHPALGGWDIINEMEGFIRTDQSDGNACYDTHFLGNAGAGWAGQTYTARQLLKFINWQVDAIRRTDPSAQVTVGAWTQKSVSDHFGGHNLYADHCLTGAGNRGQGTLTFFTTHTYDWQGRYSDDAPFNRHADDYGLNKPLVVAEFNQVRGGGHPITELYNHFYYYGYGGAWSWHANADGSDTDDTDTQMRGIAWLKDRNDQSKGGMVHLSL